MKRCSHCGETKPLDEFYCQRRVRDGRQYNTELWPDDYLCKACDREITRQWRRANASYLAMLQQAGIRRREAPVPCAEGECR